jgi:hypothetical protein
VYDREQDNVADFQEKVYQLLQVMLRLQKSVEGHEESARAHQVGSITPVSDNPYLLCLCYQTLTFLFLFF